MKTLRLLWLVCSVAMGGCASSEGGVVGSGISSITGNVSLIKGNGAASADGIAAVLPFPVRVSIDEAPGIAGTTDTGGNFELTGDFSGQVTLRFADATQAFDLGLLHLSVPAGSTVVLENIEIRLAEPQARRVQPRAVRQFDFLGRVDFVVCEHDGSGTLLVSDKAPAVHRRQFMVRVLPDSEIVDRTDDPLDCLDIAADTLVVIDGVLLTDGTIAALEIVVSPSLPHTQSRPLKPVDLRGVVTSVDCPAGVLEAEDSRVEPPLPQRVQMSRNTNIRCASPSPAPCGCESIRVGDRVAIQGVIRTNEPGAVQASSVLVELEPSLVNVIGEVHGIHCESPNAGAFRIRQADEQALDGRPFTVRVLASSEISCGVQAVPCSCTDIRTHDRVMVEGILHIDRPRTIDAELIHRLDERHPPMSGASDTAGY